MCRVRREHLDCTHTVDNHEYCANRKVNPETGKYSPCRTMKDRDVTNVYNVPGHCGGCCWYTAAVRKGWQCHMCHFGNNNGEWCKSPGCTHRCCYQCKLGGLLCCLCGVYVERGLACPRCRHRSCSRCTTTIYS
ncbi:hypothetical protein MCOR27_005042 [Pyricularia oryzae]|uniref:Uncharacterized protein n=5 Tax=Pyricularia TaxID=48558 RepID=A0ABQ8NRJ8_PYRGI|nr:uncharacterized protein MGG_05396 [Pyricularia oryzae 70-15]ELQ32415.1 hypothetical protein OOU_Y34scaffold01166g5 [Pyricularia oryzae Y34]KAH8841646.1 hypothetical protein MCOR01_005599 [Pyricularia oryzae]KAI6300151.1 hypothetical protein MCOR33_004043 [Pyricularia grisea]EHA57641.1 hypothetical protein MGG_05396 [Pyricularia oryzae 70-15]KAH9434805.1 hypothetical protein MCOR02_003768 [Pyricularia oryzae]